jgi:hypothetical protein
VVSPNLPSANYLDSSFGFILEMKCTNRAMSEELIHRQESPSKKSHLFVVCISSKRKHFVKGWWFIPALCN